mmetsp:Transcript_9215/g.16952  ORF Transcript_9215/g.16952 Transcript_9215/m.16952 type:complete len:532 (-) Transcript_9215:78-1673(-)
MHLRCWAFLQAFQLAAAARGLAEESDQEKVDACASMCRPGEDGRCVYWPSAATRSDLAELFCASCTRGEACNAVAPCEEMCRWVDGKCAYHPSLSDGHSVEDIYCQSCPYCGEKGSVEFAAHLRLTEDHSLIEQMKALKAKTDEELAKEEAKLGKTSGHAATVAEELGNLSSQEHANKAQTAALDETVIGLIGGQALEESRLELSGMKLEEQRLERDGAAAMRRLDRTDANFRQASEGVEQAKAHQQRSAESHLSAHVAELQGRTLEDAAKLGALRAGALRLDNALQQATSRAGKGAAVVRDHTADGHHASSEARDAAAARQRSEQVAEMEGHIATFAGQAASGAHTGAVIQKQLNKATADLDKQKELLDDAEGTQQAASILAKKAQLYSQDELQRAYIQEDIAASAAQEKSAVLVSEGIHYLQKRTDAKIEDVSKRIAEREAAVEDFRGRAEAAATAEKAAAMASEHASEAAAAAKSRYNDTLHHRYDPRSDPPRSDQRSVPVTSQEVGLQALKAVFHPILPHLQVLDLR